MRSVFRMAMLAAMGAAACWSLPATAADEIVVGMATAQSGFMQAYDKPAMDAAMIRIDEINKAGGLLGKQIKVVEADTKSDRAEGAKAGLEVLDKGADLVIVSCDYDYGSPAALAAQAAGKISFFLCAESVKAGIQGVRGSSIYKVVLFFPQVLSVAIVVILYQSIFQTDSTGLANAILIKLHIVSADNPMLWFSDANWVRWILLWVAVWSGFGFYMVLFSAAMQSIPKDIYEAALLDGASRVKQFFRVTLPLLWDTISVAWVYLGFIALDLFALVYALTPGPGGPNHASEVMSTYFFHTAFQNGQFGYACALGVALALFSLILAAVQLRVTRRETVEL